MQQKKYYTNLDITKWICALIVVAIHVSPLQDLAPVANVFFKEVGARVAVMLFFAMSGLGFFGKLIYHQGKIVNCPHNRQSLFRYFKSIAVIYAGWSVVYLAIRLPSWWQAGWWGWTLVKDSVAAFFFQGLFYHMWYLLALLYGVPVLYGLMTVLTEKQMKLLTVLLCLAECGLSSYSWLGCGALVEHIPYYSLLDGPIHALTRTVPLLYIGYSAGRFARSEKVKQYVGAAVLFWGTLFAEAAAMYAAGVNQSSFGFLLSTPFLVYFILAIVLSAPQFLNAGLARKLRKGSVVIYCIHPLILLLCRRAFAAEQYAYWLICTFVSGGIGLAYAVLTETPEQHTAKVHQAKQK